MKTKMVIKKELVEKPRAVYMLDSDKPRSQLDHCKTAMQRNPRMAGK